MKCFQFRNGLALATASMVAFASAGCDPLFLEPSDTNWKRLDIVIKPIEAGSHAHSVVVIGGNSSFWKKLRRLSTEELEQVLSLRLIEEDEAPSVGAPILGKYKVTGSQLIFLPAFPLLPGERYVAEFRPGSISDTSMKPVKSIYSVPNQKPSTTPQIQAIYPSSDSLPANHLKFYILFSEPMHQGNIFGHFQLENITENKTVPRPFRHTELWSPDGKRLTLWFHPGRQKSGVNLNVEIGAILDEGNEYRLIVSSQLRSENGVAMKEDFVKRFRALPKDRTQPDQQTWRLKPPRADTREPVRCTFPEPLDWALLKSEIHVETKSGTEVAGEIVVSDDERVWQFVPESSWDEGDYRLAIGTVLEDLAGNSIERPFEVDLDQRPKKRAGPTAYFDFRVSP